MSSLRLVDFDIINPESESNSHIASMAKFRGIALY